MFKKIKSLLMVMVLLIALPFAAFAVDEDEAQITVDTGIENIVSVTNDEVIVNNGEVEVIATSEQISVTSENVEVEEVKAINDVESEVEAEEAQEIEVEIETEVEDAEVAMLSTNLGAKIRLIQLQKTIDGHIEGANLIISEVEKSNSTTIDTVKLKEIVSEFEVLSAQISSADLNKDADTLAAEFVAMKQTAINLTGEFAKTVKMGLNEDQKTQIRAQIKANHEERKELRHAELEKLKLEYNVKKAKEIMARYGVEDTNLIAKLESGEIKVEDIKSELKLKFNNLNNERKIEVLQKAKEEELKLKIQLKQEREDLLQEAKIKHEELRKEAKLNHEELKIEFKKQREEMEVEFKKQREEFRAEFEKERIDRMNISKAQREEMKLQIENEREEKKTEFENQRELKKNELDRQKEERKAEFEKQKEQNRLNSNIKVEEEAEIELEEENEVEEESEDKLNVQVTSDSTKIEVNN